MSLYELVFIIRQDVSSNDVDRITDEFSKIITNDGGLLKKNEYWGLRSLAYEIDNNKKGHYILLGFDAKPSVIPELERKIKLSEDVIRYVTIKVDSMSSEPSAILRNKNSDNDVSIDVTLNRDNIED
ncbi:MAG: 30S ribosomal protein S6 [Rickettsiaceae bacterium]|nr:30S ribosomal protein S6 [Rickettsiaceae bacterium]